MSTMRMYLDDERPTPEGWVRVYTAQEAIALLATGTISEVSLDHDLGSADDSDGYDVACYIEQAAHAGTLPRIKWNVHSANPSGASKMKAALESADRFWDSRE